MKGSVLPSLIKDSQNKLFSRTRWRIATWYAGMMGAVVALCASGVYHALIYAYRLTIIQELDLVANELHEALEPILEQPGKLTPAATEILPNLCLVNTKCSNAAQQINQSTLQFRQYHIRLFDSEGKLIAVKGKQNKNLVDINSKDREMVSVELETKDFQFWGFLQVGHSSSGYTAYITNLRWILIISLPTVMVILILISWWLA
ncbi:MAG: two-component sensor histidine kinase, partial [Pleurocapsa sp.]